MEFDIEQLLNDFAIDENLDTTNNEGKLALVKQAIEYALNKHAIPKINEINTKLNTYQQQELENKLKGKIKDEFIKDFIKLKDITPNIDDKELNKLISENKHYQIETKQNDNNKDTITNNSIKNTIDGGKNVESEEFNIDNPLGL